MLMKFEQNHMIETTKNFELFDKKMVNHFWQSVDAILEDVSVSETIVWCLTINLKTTDAPLSVPKITVVWHV